MGRTPGIDPHERRRAALRGAGTTRWSRAPWRGEGGFSLVELTVVAAVIGVLVSLGFGSFAGATDKAQGRATEVELRTALEAALLLAQEAGGRFVVDDQPITPEQLHAEEPVLAFADTGGSDVIGVSVADDGVTIRLDELDEGGVRHTLVAESGRGVRYCSDVEPSECSLEDEAAPVASTTTTTTVVATGTSSAPTTVVTTPTTVASSGASTTTAPGNSGATAAAQHRQNGR